MRFKDEWDNFDKEWEEWNRDFDKAERRFNCMFLLIMGVMVTIPISICTIVLMIVGLFL